MSSKIETVEKRLEEKKRELPKVPDELRSGVKEEIGKLRQTRDKLHRQRTELDDRLVEGKVLSVEEERR